MTATPLMVVLQFQGKMATLIFEKERTKNGASKLYKQNTPKKRKQNAETFGLGNGSVTSSLSRKRNPRLKM